MAHEINNPTSFVAVNIQTLEENLPVLIDAFDENATGEQKKKARMFVATISDILAEMKNGVARIRNIVNGLKTYAHAGSEKRQCFDINECIESALHLCANKLKHRVKVWKKIVGTPVVYGDKYQLDQVFVNLFTNAADAIEETGKDGALDIEAGGADGNVTVTVRDNGQGIPAASLEKIFMPFFTTKAIGKGTGLGLSISRNIIKDHNGDLRVENIADGGAQFTIVLPSKPKGES